MLWGTYAIKGGPTCFLLSPKTRIQGRFFSLIFLYFIDVEVYTNKWQYHILGCWRGLGKISNAQKFQELTKVGTLVGIYWVNVKQELKEHSGAEGMGGVQGMNYCPGGKESIKVGFLPGHTRKCPLGSGTDGPEREFHG